MKGRSSTTHSHKCDRIKKWYKGREKFLSQKAPINEHTKKEVKRKELKPLEWYLEKVKRPNK